jgi:uncharacterized protein YxjI
MGRLTNGEAMFALENYNSLVVTQVIELPELLLNFETRNKYTIKLADGSQFAYAAEQQKGLFGFLFRQTFGHWRTFDIYFFDNQRNLRLKTSHPFRFLFPRLDVFDPQGQLIGAIQARFAIFSKKFQIEDAQGNILMKVSSPIWRIWTFPFIKDNREVSRVEKKWSGLLKEAFTDADIFRVIYASPDLNNKERNLILAASVFIDLRYFEKKANGPDLN